MTASAKLHMVEPGVETVAEPPPPPDMSYEHRQRLHIASRDWAAVHVAADRRAPLHLPDQVKRLWTK
jgi:hypothetical protein